MATYKKIRTESERIQRITGGSASVPSISWNSDTNTGIYHSSSNNIRMTINGTKAFELDSSRDLHIDGKITSNGSQVLTTSSSQVSSWNSAYGWGDHASAGYLSSTPTGTALTNLRSAIFDVTGGGDSIGTNDSQNFHIKTNSTYRISVTNTGDISLLGNTTIGTHNSNAHRLAIESKHSSVPYGQLVAGSSDQNQAVGFQFTVRDSNGSEIDKMWLTNTGLGIGTSSPTSQGTALHIYQNHASNNTFLTVESDGANASAYIDIDTASNRDGFIRFKEAGTDKASIFNDASADSLVLTDGANSNTVFIKSDKVGIGVVPTQDLEMKFATDKHMLFSDSQGETGNCPTIHTSNTDGSALVDLGFRADNIKFATGSAERMRVRSTGVTDFYGQVNVSHSAPFLYVGDASSNNSGSWDANIMLDSHAHSRLRIEQRNDNKNLELYVHGGYEPLIRATDSATKLRLGVGAQVPIEMDLYSVYLYKPTYVQALRANNSSGLITIYNQGLGSKGNLELNNITGAEGTFSSKLGIGRASAGSKLEILQGVGNGSSYDVIKIDGDTGNYGGMWMTGEWANGIQGRIGFYGTSISNRGVGLIGGTGTTPDLYINGSGQITSNETTFSTRITTPQVRFTDSGGTTFNHLNTAQWQSAYGWGNHASAGYYKSGDTLSISSISNTGSYTELHNKAIVKRLYVAFPNGTANQKADIIIPNTIASGRFWGEMIVTLTSGYSHENASGSLKCVFGLGLNHNGSEYTNTRMVMVSEGKTPNNFTMDDAFRWDSANSRWYLRIAHLKSTGNQCYITIEAQAVDDTYIENLQGMTVSSVFTNNTTYPKCVYEYNNNFDINAPTLLVGSHLNADKNPSGPNASANGITISGATAPTLSLWDTSSSGFHSHLTQVGSDLTLRSSGTFSLQVGGGTRAMRVNSDKSITFDGIPTFSDDVHANENIVLRTNNHKLYGLTTGSSTIPLIGVNGSNVIEIGASGYANTLTGNLTMYNDLYLHGGHIRPTDGVLTIFDNTSGSWGKLNSMGVNLGDWWRQPSYGQIYNGGYDFKVFHGDANGATTTFMVATHGGVTAYGAINPSTNNSFDLGHSSTKWKDAYFTGSVNSHRSFLEGTDAFLQFHDTGETSTSGSGIHTIISADDKLKFMGRNDAHDAHVDGFDLKRTGLVDFHKRVDFKDEVHINNAGKGLFVMGAYESPYTQNIAEFKYGGNSNSILIKNVGGSASISTDGNALQLCAYDNVGLTLATDKTATFGGNISFGSAGASSTIGAGITHHTNAYVYMQGGSNGLILGNSDASTRVQFMNGSTNFENNGSISLQIDSSKNFLFKSSEVKIQGANTSFVLQNTTGNYYRHYINDSDHNLYSYYNSTLIRAYSPVVGWDIRGKSQFSDDLAVYGGKSIKADFVKPNTANTALAIGDTNNIVHFNASMLRYKDNGDSPTFQFKDSNNNVQGSIYAHNGNQEFGLLDRNDNWAYRNDTNGDKHSWYHDGTEVMYLDDSGNLDIDGSLREGSDIRLKEDISTVANPLDKISKIRGVDFTWKRSGQRGGGVIAQEVQEVMPDYVYDKDNGSGHLSVDYNGLIGTLIESVKELKQEVESLKAKCKCKGE